MNPSQRTLLSPASTVVDLEAYRSLREDRRRKHDAAKRLAVAQLKTGWPAVWVQVVWWVPASALW